MEEEKSKVITWNPFFEYGITTYEQYKNFPFLEHTGIKYLKNKINSSISCNFKFPERFLILGEAGSGKTTSLFYVNDLLKDCGNCNVIILSKLFSDYQSFEMISGENLRKLLKFPTFILVDFPDTISGTKFSKFLDFLWTLISEETQNHISLVFALNISHYNKSYNYSEVLGKFDKFRLERLTLEETKDLITKRLSMINQVGLFEDGVYRTIYEYSKGIPRNIICASKTLLDQFPFEKIITNEMASTMFKSSYIEQIIHDRIESRFKRDEYIKVINIIKDKWKGKVEKQEDLVNFLQEEMKMGRNKVLEMVNNLTKFGIVSISKGGHLNTKKIISLLS